MKKHLLVALAGYAVAAQGVHAAPVAITDTSLFTPSMQARWRDLDGDNNASQAEIFVEAPTVTPPPGAQAQVDNLPTGAISNMEFSFQWTGTALVTSLNGISSAPYAVTSPTFTDLLFFIRTQGRQDAPNQFTPITLALSDLTIGATNYGGISLTSAASSAGVTGFWVLENVLNSAPFTLTGKLSLGDIPEAAGSAENWRFEVTAGDLAPIPEPSTYALMLAGLFTLGWIARRRASM